MKKLIAILTLVPGVALGNLIDVTPGGFHEGDLPQPFVHFLVQERSTMQFFDSMSALPYTINGVTYPPGWVSQFGTLNGGTYFFAHIDQTGPVPQTTISWNFTGTDFYLRYILAEGDSDWANLYRIPYRERIENDGVIVINGIVNIDSLAFYGNIPGLVPDSGSAFFLFFIGFISLYAIKLSKSFI